MNVALTIVGGLAIAGLVILVIAAVVIRIADLALNGLFGDLERER